MQIQLPKGPLALDKTAIVGVVNITPDSFSDGGEFLSSEKAVARALQLEADGATMIDLGAESTRPGAEAVDVVTQIKRLLPVIEGLMGRLIIPLSVDTGEAEVIAAMADTQVAMINDIYALQKPGALAAFAKTNMAVCLMHMQNTPKNMQHNPNYNDVVQEVRNFLTKRVEAVLAHGVDKKRIVLDPGFGFGKSVGHNFYLLQQLQKLQIDKFPLYVGLSRKSMLNAVIGESTPKDRLFATIGVEVFAALQGAHLIRTHDVRALKDALLAVEYTQNCAIT